MPDNPIPNDPILDRLNDQIQWFDIKSGWNQARYKLFKVLVIVAAASITFLTALSAPDGWDQLKWTYTMRWVIGILGVLITASEGIVQLYRFNDNWLRYRRTSEVLKSEKYLYLGEAGPYATAANRHAVLAERVEAAISEENQQWVTLNQQQNQPDQQQPPQQVNPPKPNEQDEAKPDEQEQVKPNPRSQDQPPAAEQQPGEDKPKLNGEPDPKPD